MNGWPWRGSLSHLPIEQVLSSPITAFLGGAIISLAGSYFIFSKKVGEDTAFLKGQMSQLIEMVRDHRRVRETVLIQGKDLERAKADIDSAHSKLRSLIQSLQQ